MDKITRREFLKGASLFCAGALLLPNQLYSNSLFEIEESRSLKFYNVHTGQKLDITYYEHGNYLFDALSEIDNIMADYRANEIIQMDVKLMDTLYKLQRFTGTREPINIISAYRSPQTNRRLRRHSRGVAKNSYHILGQAIDINIKGVSLKNIRDIGLTLRRGGVGYYPKSNFVHLDVGPVRSWRG